VAFAVVGHVTQERLEPLPAMGLANQRNELDQVVLRAAVDHQAQEQVAGGVNDGRELRKTAVMAAPTLTEVAGDVPRFQAGGVDGRQTGGRGDQAGVACLVDGGVQKPLSAPFFRSRSSARQRVE